MSLRLDAIPLFRWLELRDFDEALAHARIGVIKRFARGNVSFQNGNLLDDEGLAELRAIGDRAISDLRALTTERRSDDENHRLPAAI